MFGSLTAAERQALLRKMRNAMLTNRIEAEALISQPAAASGITADQAIESLTECANVVLGMYPDPEPPLTDSDRAILAGAEPANCGWCGHPRQMHYRDGSEQGGGCDAYVDGNAPAGCQCPGFRKAQREPAPTSARHDWAAEAAEREQYAGVLAADEAEQFRWESADAAMTEAANASKAHSATMRQQDTGTGWPA